MNNYAEPGDWIIHNPGDKDPYVFGNKDETIEERQKQFEKKYEIIPWEKEKFRAKGIIKAIQIKENVVFDTSWGATMWVKAWGYVADWWYGIAEESFANTYEKIDLDKEKINEIENLKKDI